MTAVYHQKDIDYFNVIAQSLEESLNTASRRAGFFEIPDASYNQLRKQYNPEYIIRTISELSGDHEEPRIGIVDVDIYVRGLNFIFGLANPLRNIALVSISRLSGPKLGARLAKEVVHEMGHLLGLNHCANPHCVMYFSNTVEDTDKKSKRLCNICQGAYEG